MSLTLVFAEFNKQRCRSEGRVRGRGGDRGSLLINTSLVGRTWEETQKYKYLMIQKRSLSAISSSLIALTEKVNLAISNQLFLITQHHQSCSALDNDLKQLVFY